jgi:hypothetical protein
MYEIIWFIVKYKTDVSVWIVVHEQITEQTSH